jgi:hypothetical protein
MSSLMRTSQRRVVIHSIPRRSGSWRYAGPGTSNLLNRFQERAACRRMVIKVERNGAPLAREQAGDDINGLEE